MSAATPSNSASCGSSQKRKNSEDEGIQRKRPSIGLQLQAVDERFTDEVDGETADKESSLISRDPESREIRDHPSISMFPGASHFQVSNSDIITVGGDATFIRFGDGQFTEVQRDLIGDYIATLAALPGINASLKKHILTQLIINLPRAEAVFNDYQTKKKSGPCFEGTRVTLLREMANWVTGQDESRMYILSGIAGIGKSTVAYTIASRAADLNLLGASFFFSRDEADRNNAKKLFTTIAYQLCAYDERFAKSIGDALLTERGSAAVTKDPQEQLQALIIDPLRDILQSRVRPILVVVDALDECCEADVRGVIQGLGHLVRNLPSFKVILTARPHHYIDSFLANQGDHRLFRLHDIEAKIVDGDIRLYLEYNLSLEQVREHYPRRQWCASHDQIDSLVRAAGRLFIIASTSVRYILDRSVSNPAVQMKKLLHASSQDYNPFKDLSCFYTVILRNAVPESCDDETVIRYQSVVGAIIFIQSPLPVSVLGHLIQTDVEDIYGVLDNLQSVILLGDDDVPRIYHKSFPDFVTDQAHCKDSYLKIDPMVGHTQLAKHCFGITSMHLKYNILGLGTPARFMSNEDGLKKDGITEEQLEEKIPQELRYACVYWVAHLQIANITDGDIMDRLDKFVNGHMLHWLEVLSLIRKLDLAYYAIHAVFDFLESASSELHRLLSDALCFISKFYEIINRSALHLYYSALPFSPTDSLLYHRYIQEAEHGICDIEGGPQEWDAFISYLDHGECIDDVKFSTDSAMVVSYSQKNVSTFFTNMGKLKIWDAVTGMPLSTIPGDRFAISNDFLTIASSTDNVITHYDPEGTTTGKTVITSSEIKTLAVSCESDRVAAGLFDGTVCLWESRHGKLINCFDGYDDGVDGEHWSHLQFSPSGTRLVYSSANGIVTLRDGISGRLVADLQCGLTRINRPQFSADGTWMASLSKNCGLKLWNAESGGLICAVMGVCYGELAISANGSLLATADQRHYRYRATLWSASCDQLIKIKILKSNGPFSIAFSPDSNLVISGLDGIKTYNIETDTTSTYLTSGTIGPLAFSPDGTRLVCGTLLCDAQSIYTSSSQSRVSPLTAIALSRDCSRLSCGFWDGRVELWETGPMMRRIASRMDYGIQITGMDFGPDSRRFASWSYSSCIIRLWDGGDGSLLGTLSLPTKFKLATVALSHRMLIAGGRKEVTLWDPNTLSLLHTIPVRLATFKASISDEGALGAILFSDGSIYLFDLENQTTTCIFTRNELHLQDYLFQGLTFLPDKSQLVARRYNEELEFQSLNLTNKLIADGPILEHLIQLPDTPIWHGVPIWLRQVTDRQYCLVALFSQDQEPVPVLWIPSDILVEKWSQGSSMIAFGCRYGPVILLRLHTSYPD